MIKDSALSLLWLQFNPWPRNFCMPQLGPDVCVCVCVCREEAEAEYMGLFPTIHHSLYFCLCLKCSIEKSKGKKKVFRESLIIAGVGPGFIVPSSKEICLMLPKGLFPVF